MKDLFFVAKFPHYLWEPAIYYELGDQLPGFKPNIDSADGNSIIIVGGKLK